MLGRYLHQPSLIRCPPNALGQQLLKFTNQNDQYFNILVLGGGGIRLGKLISGEDVMPPEADFNWEEAP